MSDKDQYDDVCKGHFGELKDLIMLVQQGQDALRSKLFESNGERALVEHIRDNTEWRERMDGLFKKAVAGIIALILGGHGLDKLADFMLK